MDIQDLLDKNGIQYEEIKTGWLNMDCPFCFSERKLGFNYIGSYWNCWKCGFIPFTNVVMELTSCNYARAKEIQEELGTQSHEEHKHEHDGRLQLPDLLTGLKRPHLDYLKDRGFCGKELARLWDIRGICLHLQLSWRIFIPICYRNACVSWTTRSIVDGTEPRYISAKPEQERIPHKQLLFGEDYCRSTVIVHEGPFDVFRTGPGAVGTLGIDVTEDQVARLIRWPKRVICFDNEPLAKERAKALCRRLSIYPGETLRVEIDAKDPGSASKKEVRMLRKMLD